MNDTLTPSFSCDLTATIGGHAIVAFNAGPAGEVYVLLAVEPMDYRTADNGFASFAKITPDSPQQYRVLVLRKGELELDLSIRGERFNIHEIQPLGNNLLLACVRSQYRGENDVDLNARLYSREGEFLRAFLLGDGLAAIQTTREGEIWTSYFDEGIFGNYGWDVPLGAAGLVAWNDAGEKVYEYDATEPAGPIDDCYALNVASADDVWCCYYADFPLVHLHKKRIASAWKVPVSGSHAFAVSGEYVLFAGGDGNPDSLKLVRLAANGTAMPRGEFELVGDNGTAVKLDKTIGRGAVLYVISDAILYEIQLEEVLAMQDARTGRG